MVRKYKLDVILPIEFKPIISYTEEITTYSFHPSIGFTHYEYNTMCI